VRPGRRVRVARQRGAWAARDSLPEQGRRRSSAA
jgi:hypothetical protein